MEGKLSDDMYDKVPLIPEKNKGQLLVKDHNNRFSKFSQKILCAGGWLRCHQIIALSSKQQKNTGSEVSYHTYRHTCAVGSVRSGWRNGSMTLEMTIVLPLVATFLVFFLFLFRVLWVQESLEEALLYASRSLAVSCYDETENDAHSQVADLAKAQLLLRKGLADSECPVQFIRGGKNGISLLTSDCSGDEIQLQATYEMQVPCPLIGTYSYHLIQCARSRKWIGNRSLEDGTSDDDTWVYITPEGRAYHRSLSCNYLDLSIRAVNQRALLSLRNESGKRYQRCETCGSTGGMTVYITDYGTRYHTQLSCSGLKRTVYMVKLTQTGGRHACGKCGAGSQS